MTISRRRKSAFTLLEILLVLALIGLLAAMLIPAAGGLASDKKSAEDFFWQGVQAARKQALLAGREVRMTFVAAKKDEPAALVLTLEGVAERVEFDLPEEVTLDFLSTQKSRSSIVVAGEAVETQTMPAVTFYGDGTCTPFRAQIRINGGNVRMLAIDPWTCAQVLPKLEETR